MKIKSKNHEQMTLVDSKGRTHLENVLLTFKAPDLNKAYVLFYPADEVGRRDLGVHAYALPAGADPANLGNLGTGRLIPVRTQKEWDVIESVLNTFLGPQQSTRTRK